MIYDIISSDISVAGEAEFTVNDAVLEVAVLGPGLTGLKFANAAGFPYFDLGDNLNLLAMWCNIPFGFGQGTDIHNIGLAYWNGATFEAMTPFPSVGSSLNIPSLCGPVNFPANLQSRMPTTGVKRQVRLTDIDLNVSMINVPADLNGEVIKVQYHMAIAHSFPMQAVP